MPLQKGWKNVSIRPDVVSKLKQGFNAERDKYPKSATLGTYVNEVLDWVLDNKDYIRRYAPFKWIGSSGPTFLIYDNFSKSTIDVEIHGGERMLWCREDKTDDCDHIGFCWAQSDVYKELRKHGFKPPKAR
ncbi:MAG: hypothetical protein ACE5J2_02160 [Nitrososphaerales archaeon]